MLGVLVPAQGQWHTRSKSSKATEVVTAGAWRKPFSEVHWDRRRGSRHKLEHEKFWLGKTGKNCHELIKLWNQILEQG